MLKRYNIFIKAFLPLLFLQLVLSTHVFGALHGVYTINPGAVASATNYKNFTSAINDLKLGTRTDGGPVNGSGVSAAVTFNVAAGTYTGQVDIPLINGVSSTNTITFDGSSPASCILVANSTPSPNISVVKFDTAQFVTVKNFTITTTVTIATDFSCGVQFMGTKASFCNNNMLKNCVINEAYIPYLTYNFSPAMDGVLFNGSSTSADDGGYFKNNVVDGCTINQGFYGMYLLGAALDSCTGNVFKNNILNNYASAGIFALSLTAPKFLNNTISSNNTSVGNSNGYWWTVNTGMYISSCDGTTSDFIDISGNTIMSFWENGINFNYNTGTPGMYARISNNFVTNGTINSYAYDFSCINLSGNQYYQVLNNSMQLSTPSLNAGNSAFSEDGSSLAGDIRNNIFSYSATSGKGTPFFGGDPGNYVAFDYNIFYNADTAKYGVSHGTLYTTAQVGGGSLNSHSLIANPNFKSPIDFHLQNIYAGKPGVQTVVTTDIDGETRGNPPLIGADDFPIISGNDEGVSSIVSPVYPVPTGLQTIAVRIINTGTGTLTSATVKYILNGAAAVSQAWNGSLAQGDSADFSFTTKGNFLAGLNTIKIFTSQPNGSADTYNGNDTLTLSLYSALNGVYTINGAVAASATNFVSFGAATTALNGGVVTGPVLINVAPATYTEQVELKVINGASLTNTVRFDGKDTSKVTLTWKGSFGSQHTLKLSGCNYVTFSGMRIIGSNGAFAWPVHFAADGTSYNKIVGCSISVPLNEDNLNECPVVFSTANGWAAPYFFPPAGAGYNEIDSCTFSGGKTSIMAYIGRTSGGAQVLDTVNAIDNKFIGNYFTNYHSWGLYLAYGNGCKVLNNVCNPNSKLAGGMLISGVLNSIDDFVDVSGNTIKNFGYNLADYGGTIQSGLFITGCNGSSGRHIRVSNNMIGGLLTVSNCLFMISCKNVDIVNNSFNYDADYATLESYAAIRDNSAGPNIFKNNIMAVTAEVGSASCFFEIANNAVFTPDNFDYNIFYNSANKNSAYIGGVMYNPFHVAGGAGLNLHSYTMDPTFKSATDLHITTQSNLGISLAGVTKDFDGQTRAANPCIGADEINIGCTVPSLAGIITGDTIVCEGQTGILYSVSTVGNAISYIWTFPNGASIVTGNNTSNITVNFSSIANDGTITVAGKNACGNGSPSVPLFLTVNPLPIVTVTPQSVKCKGDCNGEASAIIQGSGNYHFNWNTTDTVNHITGLCPGNYTVTVTDVYGCSAIQNGVISDAVALNVTTAETDDTCLDKNCHIGTAFVSATGGTAPYTYNWDDGETTQSISGLSAGLYRVCVIDAHNCITCDSVIVNQVTGIKQITGTGQIQLFPNPNHGIFTMIFNGNSKKGKAALFTITGKLVYEEDFTNTYNHVFDISSFGKAVYILQITSDKGVLREKVVVQ